MPPRPFRRLLEEQVAKPMWGPHSCIVAIWYASPGCSKGSNSGDRLSDDQRVNILRAFIGFHRLQVHHVTHDWIIVSDAVAAEHIARHARAFQGDSNIVSLGHRDMLVADLPGILEAAHLQGE